ncbi:hypothetical protein ACVGWT_11695, partial [Enterobacter hormaechei]
DPIIQQSQTEATRAPQKHHHTLKHKVRTNTYCVNRHHLKTTRFDSKTTSKNNTHKLSDTNTQLTLPTNY